MTEATKTPKKTAKRAPGASVTASEPKAKKLASKEAKKPKTGLYAVFATGGKQYRVQAGDTLRIEKLVGEHAEGDKLVFDDVLMTDNGGAEVTLGKPFIKGSSVTATLSKIARYKTVDVIKYKQKSRYFKKYGHRQPYFEIKITEVK